MRLSRKSSGEKTFRETPVGARRRKYPGEVHSVSGVLKAKEPDLIRLATAETVGTTGATVTSPRLFNLSGEKLFFPWARSLRRHTPQGICETEW